MSIIDLLSNKTTTLPLWPAMIRVPPPLLCFGTIGTNPIMPFYPLYQYIFPTGIPGNFISIFNLPIFVLILFFQLLKSVCLLSGNQSPCSVKSYYFQQFLFIFPSPPYSNCELVYPNDTQCSLFKWRIFSLTYSIIDPGVRYFL